MKIKPIGKVVKLPREECVLEIDPAYKEGLQGIKAGDRLHVLYWMHKLAAGDRQVLKVHPQGDTRRPLKGVFAVRSPVRPNPIGVSIVTVARLSENRLFVAGLDAMDGSPVIDIKSSSAETT